MIDVCAAGTLQYNKHMKNPPTTIEEVGTHLFYMSKQIDELKNSIQELPNGFASKQDIVRIDRDVSVLDVRVAKLEDRQNIKNTLLWVGLVASAIINIVTIYRLFTGG